LGAQERQPSSASCPCIEAGQWPLNLGQFFCSRLISVLFVNTFVADFVICKEVTATDVPVSIRSLESLSTLVDAGLLERRCYSERPPRYEYVLTEMGRDFPPVIVAIFTSFRIFS
jgi:HxlR-like helix-turn-helix